MRNEIKSVRTKFGPPHYGADELRERPVCPQHLLKAMMLRL
jgi:hypothetical protein